MTTWLPRREKALRDLAEGEDLLIITNGAN